MAQRRRPRRTAEPDARAVETTAATVAKTVATPMATGVPRVAVGWLTLERALYALILLIAGGLRFGRLGRWPLSQAEAATALDAWRFLQGAGGSVLGHSPLLFNGDLATFALFGSGDAQARIVAALSAVVLIGLPFLLRPILGRTGALMAALFLAISPTLLFFSRQDVPAVLAATCALGVLAGLTQFRRLGNRRALYLAAVFLGLGLASGPSFYMHAFLWGLFVIGAVAARQKLSALKPWLEPAWLAQAGVIAAGTFFLASTALLTNWAGLQAAVALPGAWLHSLRPTPSGYPWSYYVSRLVLYEPLAVLFGLAAVAGLVRHRRPEVAFATVWFVAALLAYSTLGASRAPSNLVVIVLPLTLLAGGAAGQLLDDVAEKAEWGVEGAYLGLASLVAVFAVLNLHAYANSGTDRYLGLALVGLATLLVLLALVGYWSGLGGVIRAGGLALLLFLTLGTVRSAWNLSLERADNPAEPLMTAATSPDVRQIPVTIANVSNERLRDRETIEIAYHESLGAVIGWYVRDFDNARTLAGYDAPSLPPVIITPFSNEPPPLGEGYIGQRFHLRRTWAWPELRGRERARWLFYRDVTTGYTSSDVIVYVQVPEE